MIKNKNIEIIDFSCFNKINASLFNNSFTLNEIIKTEGLSAKILNRCKELNISSIFDLFKYYNKNKTFKGRNFGEKSNQDLINIINKYGKIFPEEIKKIEKENNIKKLKKTINEINWESVIKL